MFGRGVTICLGDQETKVLVRSRWWLEGGDGLPAHWILSTPLEQGCSLIFFYLFKIGNKNTITNLKQINMRERCQQARNPRPVFSTGKKYISGKFQLPNSLWSPDKRMGCGQSKVVQAVQTKDAEIPCGNLHTKETAPLATSTCSVPRTLQPPPVLCNSPAKAASSLW